MEDENLLLHHWSVGALQLEREGKVELTVSKPNRRKKRNPLKEEQGPWKFEESVGQRVLLAEASYEHHLEFTGGDNGKGGDVAKSFRQKQKKGGMNRRRNIYSSSNPTLKGRKWNSGNEIRKKRGGRTKQVGRGRFSERGSAEKKQKG